MIISASRKTDIPAFYSEWFMNQIRSGEALRKNPYNDQIYKTSLKPEDITCIVFWTRNATQILKKGYLSELDDLGIPYYFQYTITGYNKSFEKKTPHPLKAIEQVNELADKIGGNKIIWRFDPIILTDHNTVPELIRLHEKIASLIDSNIQENVISFLDDYKKTAKNMAKAGVQFYDILSKETELDELLKGIQNNASKYNLNVSTCAENINLEKYNIRKGKCIDSDFIFNQLGLNVSKAKDQGQRKECGCIKSVDIGLYNTCVHGCEYCYATEEKDAALRNFKNHDPMNKFIIPDPKFDMKNRII